MRKKNDGTNKLGGEESFTGRIMHQVCLRRRLSEYGLRFWFAQRAVEMGYKRFAIMCM